MKQTTIVIILLIVITILSFLLRPKQSAIESKTCPVDTLVVIRQNFYVDSALKHADAIYVDLGHVRTDSLFANGKTRDTIYESKIVYDK